jgi:hypothetical protein
MLTIFGPRTASVSRGNLRGTGVNRNANTAHVTRGLMCRDGPHGCAGLRCRRHGWLYSGDEGSREPGARCAGRERRVRDQQRHGRGARSGAIRPRRDRTSAPKARRSWTRGCRRRVKRAPCKAETRGAACKGVSAVRRHAGGLYDAGTYCYTLVKCLKPFVRNGKGVIEANDYAQGSSINSEPLVMRREYRRRLQFFRSSVC